MNKNSALPVAEKLIPVFNPTGAPESEIYATGRRLAAGRDLGYKPLSDFDGHPDGVDLYRLEQRHRVASGVGLVASRILHGRSLGDMENFRLFNHVVSNHKDRESDPAKTTPFVSFSSDPVNLAAYFILKRGFAVRDGSDSVVVRARVAPDRILTPGPKPHPEVLLVGGLSPDEFQSTMEIDDFVASQVAEDEIVVADKNKPLLRDAALQYWRNTAVSE